jgi:flagellar motor switch protein FliM
MAYVNLLVSVMVQVGGIVRERNRVVGGEVLRRKLLAGKIPTPNGGPGADRAWRLAFARAARDMMKLGVEVTSQTLSRQSLTEVLELPPDRGLILMLEGPSEGLGLLILSPEVHASMAEVLTMGRCGAQQPEPRKPTRTDAAMLSPLADLSMVYLEDALAEDGDLPWASGFRYASFIEEARPLGLLLEDVAYRVLNARVSLAQGTRTGDVILILPAEGRGAFPKLRAGAVADDIARPAFAAALAARIDESHSMLDVVVARLSMPLAATMYLTVDMVLPLPAAALDRISVEGLDGRRVATGKLGQNRGMRAVRLTADAEQEMTDHGAPDARLGRWTQAAADTTPESVENAFDFKALPATGTE